MAKSGRTRGSTVDVSEVVAGFKKLAGIKESLGRTIAFEMADVVYNEAHVRVPVGTEEGGSITPGLLKSALYRAYDERQTILSPDTYRYTISWNSKKAPHGHLVEFGHWMPFKYVRDKSGEYWTVVGEPNPGSNGPGGFWVEQKAFLGPAFDATQRALPEVAFSAGRRRFQELMS